MTHSLISFSSGSDSLILNMEYIYKFSSGSVNSLQVYLDANIGSSSVTSAKISLPLGEWLMFTITTTGTQTYYLSV